ncbi:general secretion pathway protein GspE [Candidatus Endoriftia persephone str. Guaymas]|jgi:type II secretory ATPase GspE/PulE/Tfp pilus assembly ATPase PilB-like protein|uniref:GspE/PulE family protein n=2 Tax=Gammaproteobacteria TaxID=1236 RepID=A0A9J6ZU12_9GAMM|nr:GspE/PulE family protein [Candidatus Endoriftia persephone]MBA1329830.1 general secretion pathway protein GspE [Candidatus Endoriftia persephone str. Guaymas]USF86260.1 GspE/PulE family protein [Candidatus Endoriftia persephone]
MVTAANQPKKQAKPLGIQLVEQGLVTTDQVEIALKEQKHRGEPLGQILISLGFISEAVLTEVIGEIFGERSVDLSSIIPDAEALALIDRETALRNRVLPITLDQENGTLTLAMEDPNNLVVLDRLRVQIPRQLRITPMIAGKREILLAIDQFYGHELSVDGILREIETGTVDYEALAEEAQEYEHPLVRLVDAIIADAVKRGASDIHFNPEEKFLRLRYRIDGVLHQIRSLHKDFWSPISVRLKVISGMNIAETRAPQDGRISMTIRGHRIDFRVSAQPTTHGENFVLRILDRAKGIVPLDKLGLRHDSHTTLKLMMARPEGIILVTGPTGSGKTTTLYSMLNHLNSPEVNIMTLEDPVEYPISMIRQTSVNEVARMDFASGIRSLMRQDPDIILVGEIRDQDTAEMAFRAAMTGHQVYSTLHTNSAARSIPRLLDIGVTPQVMTGNMIGIVAQRLIRRLCEHCKEGYQPSEIEQRLLGISSDKAVQIHRATGCNKCNNTGYKGRLALMEVLRFDDGIDDLVAASASYREVERYAIGHGFIPLAEDGIRRVLEGVTSLDELSRVADLTKRLE